jgi:hypothetical protein
LTQAVSTLEKTVKAEMAKQMADMAKQIKTLSNGPWLIKADLDSVLSKITKMQ